MPDDADVVSATALVVKPSVGQENKFNGPTRISVRRDNCAADFQMTVVIVVTTADMWRIRDAEPESPIPLLDFNDVPYLIIRGPFSALLELGSPFVVYHPLDFRIFQDRIRLIAARQLTNELAGSCLYWTKIRQGLRPLE